MNDRQLTVLGGQIRSAIAAAEKAGRGFMDAAYVAGEKLLKAKENVKRGEWQAWVQEHAGIELRAAQRYMRIASRWEELEDESSMTKALEGISVKVKNVTRVAKPPKGSRPAAGDSQAVCSPPRAEGANDEAPSVPVQEAWELSNLDVVKTAWGQATKTEQTEIASWVEDQMAQRRGRRRGEFVPPSLAEVRAYCQERNNGIEASAFLDHYVACGWVQGKARKPVKDWKACVRTWERMRTANGKGDPDTVRV